VNAATIAERQTTRPASLPAPADTPTLPDYGTTAAPRRYLRRIAGVVEDAVLLVLAVLLLPVVIYLVGTPLALCIQAIIEIVRFVS